MTEIRGLPHNNEAEAAFLGGLFFNPESLDDVREKLAPTDLFGDVHRKIYTAMLAMADANEPVDVVTVCDRLEKDGWLERVGGPPAVMDLTSATPTASSVGHYVGILSDLALRRRAIQTMGKAIEEMHDDATPAKLLVESAQDQMHSIDLPSGVERVTGREAAQGALRLVLAARKGERGLPTPYAGLNASLGGFRGGDLITVAGVTSSGKSVILNGIAYHIASDANTKGDVAAFSLEMQPPRIALRRLADVANIRMDKLLMGEEWRYGEEDRFKAGLEALAEAKIVFHDHHCRRIDSIRSACRRMARSERGLSAVVVDYIQLVHPSRKHHSRATEIAELTSGAKDLAMELNVPVIIGAQLNREGFKRPNPSPRISDLRESASIEHDSDIVMFIHRPVQFDDYKSAQAKKLLADDWTSPEDYERSAKLILAKNRDNRLGSLDLVFEGSKMRFKEKVNNVEF